MWKLEYDIWRVEVERTYILGTTRATAGATVGCCTTRMETVMGIGENTE